MKQIKIDTERGAVNYTPVHERIKGLKEDKVDYSISTSYEYIKEEKRFIVSATLNVFRGGSERSYCGHASEVVGEGGEANEYSALENAETSAVGRALAFFGLGIDAGIASAEEMKHVLTPEQIVEKLTAHLQSIKTKEAVEDVAEQFRKKHAELYSRRNVQNIFKKRIGEIVIEQTIKKNETK